MKIAVIGAGPIGSTYAAFLQQANHSIIVIDKSRPIQKAIYQKGLTIKGALEAHVKSVYNQIEDANTLNESLDAVFIAVKTYFLDSVLPSLDNVMHKSPKTRLVCVENGLENEVHIAQIQKERGLDVPCVHRLVINFAGSLERLGVVNIVWSQPPSYIGAYNTRTRRYESSDSSDELACILTKAGLETKPVSDIRYYEMEKTIKNSALFGLCSAYKMTMKQVMDDPLLSKMAEDIIKEGLAVAAAYGYDYGPTALQDFMGYLKNGRHHYPSIMQDLSKGLPTENKFVNTAISVVGRKMGVATPLNELFASYLNWLETNSGLYKLG